MFAYCLNNPVNMADYDGEDAIYVVDYGPDGLPIVGHSRIYIQDEDGNWYVTQYMGKYPWTATVGCRIPTGKYEDELNRILNNESLDQGMYIYIEGGFAESCKIAEGYKGTNYGGYSLLFNNCMHYTREILSYGEFENPAIKACLYSSAAIAPIVFYEDLVIAKTTGVLRGGGMRYDGEKWQIWHE